MCCRKRSQDSGVRGQRKTAMSAERGTMSCSSLIAYRSSLPPAPRPAFSLVELMVVIVIIGLLAGTVTLSVRSYLVRGKQNVARSEIAKICQAIDTYYAEYDRFPTSDEGIEILAGESPKFPEGILTNLPLDPWGNAYEYLNPGREESYEVISYGADGREGGEKADADLSSAALAER